MTKNLTHKIMPAEASKRYRDRLRAEGKTASRGKSGKRLSKWKNAEFIALDGEGASIGEVEKFSTEEKTYYAKEHIYTLLAASSGESLYNGGARLDSYRCIDFLCDLADTHSNAIFVIFAGSYDINHILMYGFGREQLKKIGAGETIEYERNNIRFAVEYRARKSLTLRRGFSTYRDKKGKWKPRWESVITIWDVWGFFQDSFVGVMKKWLGENHKHFSLIVKMKALRGDFASVPQADINAYNAAELECLVEIMQKVHAAIDGLGLQCTRWDGAGAVAAAMLKEHKVKDYKYNGKIDVSEPVRIAYAGGRIEVCKIGVHNGAVYDYDINSAYPSAMLDLPCLAHGTWHWEGRSNYVHPGFVLIHVRYKFKPGQPFYPLFYRNDKMQICFPAEGEGWYWYPEFKAAVECLGELEILESWRFMPQCNHKPFHWIEHYYKTRQMWVKNPTEEWQKGAEKIIKLGLNSLYGKTAQQLGGRNDRPPAYHEMSWAGYITSATRARLYSTARLCADAVIGFATDGLFLSEPLPIQPDRNKLIGAWDLKEFDGLTLAMAGVYWWHAGDKFNHFSRGFDKEAMQTPLQVMEAWKKGASEIDIAMHRLIGIGSACASDLFWQMRGRFTDGMRTLALDGDSHKRTPVDVKKTKPYKQLVALAPNLNTEYAYGASGCSFPYPVKWMRDDDFENELEQERETMDTENI